jgi:hypothetical protein
MLSTAKYARPMTESPDQPLAAAPARPYGTDLGRFTADYPDFRHFAIGVSCAARADVDGQLVGELITALTLDELADKLDKLRRRLAGA